MAGRCGRRGGAHPVWDLAVANPTALDHLGLDRTDQFAWRLGPLLRDLGPPPRIGCGAGALFVQQIIYMSALGWLVFGNVPDSAVVLGACVVVGSGLYLLWREVRVR